MTDRTELLELMYGAWDGLRSCRLAGRRWWDGGLQAKATNRAVAIESAWSTRSGFGRPDEGEYEERWVLAFERPSRWRAEDGPRIEVLDDDRFSTWSPGQGPRVSQSVVTDTGDGRGMASVLLFPHRLLAHIDIEVVGTVAKSGREAHRLRCAARPPHPYRRYPISELGEGADEYEFVVDAESGILLRTEARLRGLPFEVMESFEAEINTPLPPDTFMLEHAKGIEPEPPRPPTEHMTLEEAARRAPFTVFVPGGAAPPMYVSARWCPEGWLPGAPMEIVLIISWGPGLSMRMSQSATRFERSGEWRRAEGGGVNAWVREEQQGSRLLTEHQGTYIEASASVAIENLLQAVFPLRPAPTQLPRLSSN